MTSLKATYSRLRSRVRQNIGRVLARRPFLKRGSAAYVSFTFDDFPRSAFLSGGAILERYGVRGTYYISLGLIGVESAVGEIARLDDLHGLLRHGHELGCHTYDHLDGWSTSPQEFERSVIRNRHAFREQLSGGDLALFAYPIADPRPSTKRLIGRHFRCCRGGGQRHNSDNLDLNLLEAFFMDWRNLGHPGTVRARIDLSCAEGGWLILVTHDVCESPSQYGCTPGFLEEIVRHAAQSGARILPVGSVCDELGVPRDKHGEYYRD